MSSLLTNIHIKETNFDKKDEIDTVDRNFIRCYGCRLGILNQSGHMDEDGCLYMSEEN